MGSDEVPPQKGDPQPRPIYDQDDAIETTADEKTTTMPAQDPAGGQQDPANGRPEVQADDDYVVRRPRRNGNGNGNGRNGAEANGYDLVGKIRELPDAVKYGAAAAAVALVAGVGIGRCSADSGEGLIEEDYVEQVARNAARAEVRRLSNMTTTTDAPSETEPGREGGGTTTTSSTTTTSTTVEDVSYPEPLPGQVPGGDAIVYCSRDGKVVDTWHFDEDGFAVQNTPFTPGTDCPTRTSGWSGVEARMLNPGDTLPPGGLFADR